MHKRSVYDQLQRASAGQWSRLPDAPVVRDYAVWVWATLDEDMTDGAPALATVNEWGGPVEHRKYPGDQYSQVSLGSELAVDYTAGTKLLALLKDETATPKVYEIVNDTTGGGGGGSTPDIGCGLVYSSDILEVDSAALAGKGLAVGTSAMDCNSIGSDDTYCCLYVDIACGLKFVGNTIAVDIDALAGRGLSASTQNSECSSYADAGYDDTYCCLSVNIGCGLEWSGDTFFVDRLQLMGCGLKAGSGECDIDVDPDDLDGCGLKVGSSGCELDVDNTDLAGEGLEAGTGCSLNVLVDPTYFSIDSENNWITFSTPPCNAVKSIACSLEITGGKLRLTLTPTMCDDTTGTASYCEIDVVENCGA